MNLKYRKRPVVIEAWQFDPGAFDTPGWIEPMWWHEEVDHTTYLGKLRSKRGGKILIIPNEHGPATARPGNWVIRGVNGEIYPCTDDVFQKTYEKVEE